MKVPSVNNRTFFNNNIKKKKKKKIIELSLASSLTGALAKILDRTSHLIWPTMASSVLGEFP